MMWDQVLNSLYNSPASISVISGKWKTGKTDFSLFLVIDELRDRLGLIREVGSNIQTTDPTVAYVNNFMDLETFLYRNKDRKAFIFDEALKAAPSRSAMSRLNVKWLEYIPELSKARTHLFVITQEESYLEKLFLHPTFVRARWKKLDLKTVDLIKDGEVLRFRDLPKAKVDFDPYCIAKWQMEPDGDPGLEDEDLTIALDYSRGMKTQDIMEKYGLKYRWEITRALKRAIDKLYNVYRRGVRVEQLAEDTNEVEIAP